MKKAIKILSIICIVMHAITLACLTPFIILSIHPVIFVIIAPTVALQIFGLINSIKILKEINKSEIPSVSKGIISLILNHYYGVILGLLIFLSQPKEENNLI